MKTRDILATFNRGLIGRMAVARVDVERVRLSAEEQTNTKFPFSQNAQSDDW